MLGRYQIEQDVELVVVSDVHIKSNDDPRYELLCCLVDSVAESSAKGFVLNGDIFDFFFGWSHYFQQKYSRLFQGLSRLSRRGIKVWFVEGNHEFGLNGLTTFSDFTVVSSEGAIWTMDQGRKVMIAHGDLMSPDPWYQLFRAFIRSPVVYWLAWLCPQRILDAVTQHIASTSRKKDKYRELNHSKIRNAAEIALTKAHAEIIIFGHFHFPYHDHISGGRTLISLNSWDKPSCIVVKRNGITGHIYPTL